MKRLMVLLVIILMIAGIFLTACSQNVKTNTEIPEITIKTELVEKEEFPGFARKNEVYVIKDKGIKASLYYSLSDKSFNGMIENLTSEKIPGVQIEYLLENGEVLSPSESIGLEPLEKRDLKRSTRKTGFIAWKALIKIDEKDEDDKYSEPNVLIYDRQEAGAGQTFSVTNSADYVKYKIEPNQGTILDEKRWAGVDQIFTIEEKGIRATVWQSSKYFKRNDVTHYYFNFRVVNLSQDVITNVKVGFMRKPDLEYSNYYGPDGPVISRLDPGEPYEEGYYSSSYSSVMVFRVLLQFYDSSADGNSDKQKITIKDLTNSEEGI